MLHLLGYIELKFDMLHLLEYIELKFDMLHLLGYIEPKFNMLRWIVEIQFKIFTIFGKQLQIINLSINTEWSESVKNFYHHDINAIMGGRNNL